MHIMMLLIHNSLYKETMNHDDEEGGDQKRCSMMIDAYHHHLCHAASAFYTSSFSRSDVLTIDGHGEEDSCFIGYGENKSIKEIDNVKYPHSVGLLYGTFTDFLGFKPENDEWKTMALASFSKGENLYMI